MSRKVGIGMTVVRGQPIGGDGGGGGGWWGVPRLWYYSGSTYSRDVGGFV